MNKQVWLNTFFAWLVFVGTDFIFHSAIFQHLWEDPIPALKSLEDLALLIPAGYGSFFLLTLLIAYTFEKSFRETPERIQLLKFAFIWSILFAGSNFLGTYSYLEIPMTHLLAFNAVYFIEIFLVVYILNGLFFNSNKRKIRWWCVGIFFMLIITGVILQNMMTNI